MNSDTTLVNSSIFNLKLRHLLIIGILCLSFSISFLIRSQPASFGWELNEFDPFFNYRATQYMIENGIDSYFNWNDSLSWYPHGRDVSHTSQVMLHLTAATTYWIFGAGGNLYDFTILFPVVIGSLTTIIVFALVRVIGGTTAGILASLFFSISLPIIIRGQIGWFKSEPLGLFFSLIGIYLFLSGIKSKNYKISFAKIITAGILIVFGLSSWGGDQFFIIPLGIFFLTLPFLRNDHNFLLWTIPLFTISIIVTSLGFERLSSQFVFGLGGFSLIIPTIFLISCIMLQKVSGTHKTRNGLLLLAFFLITGTSVLVINAENEFLPLPSYRYLNAINPFLTTTDPLVDSVAEHATTNIRQSFLFHSILMIFAGLGIWLMLQNSKINFIKNDMMVFSLIFGLIGVYVSSAFLRLEVFASLSVIILSSIGLSILFKNLLKNSSHVKSSIKLLFSIGILALLIAPMISLENSSVFSLTNNPPTILNGGTNYMTNTNDWNEALHWIKTNTPSDSIVASWWDYGYWIQTKGERATFADNSTLIDSVIKKIAKIMLSEPDDAWVSLNEMEADYFVVFVSGQRLTVDDDNRPLYTLQGGGDESKKQWFVKIANEPVPKYIHFDGISGTDIFWNDTLLGKMIPFQLLGYVNFETQEQSLVFQPGFTAIYTKDIKFTNDGNGPLKLVYSSPGFNVEKGNTMTGVFVYEINKDYVPKI